jgi:hypothetical protein
VFAGVGERVKMPRTASWGTLHPNCFCLAGVEKREVGTSRAIIPLKPKEGLTPISCHAVLERSACAPFN